MRISLLLSLLVVFSCSTKKGISEKNDNDTCRTHGTVKDFTGLDGCKFLILLDDSTRLLPAKMPAGKFQFRDGQEIWFDYQELKDYGMTICMAEDLIIEVTCIREEGVDPADKTACSDLIMDPNQIAWMRILMQSYRPMKVTVYPFQDQYLYYFETPRVSYLHDCNGQLVCEVPGKIMNDCLMQIQALGAGRTIFLQQ
ncbi:MAG: hypothetical protein KDC24_08415 [Saprospiraceae bacterium]|nr:hypothetical protein [Saprospiraceae bacterium]